MQYSFPRFPPLKHPELQSPKLSEHILILSVLSAGYDDLIVALISRAGIALLSRSAASSKKGGKASAMLRVCKPYEYAGREVWSGLEGRCCAVCRRCLS